MKLGCLPEGLVRHFMYSIKQGGFTATEDSGVEVQSKTKFPHSMSHQSHIFNFPTDHSSISKGLQHLLLLVLGMVPHLNLMQDFS